MTKTGELTEADVMALAQRAVTAEGGRVFRNNVGTGWQSRQKALKVSRPTDIVMQPGDVLLRGAQYIHFGLFKGSADEIGWRPVVITPEMVGRTIAQFVSLEYKATNGRVDADQQNWMEQVRGAGGLAAIVRDPAVVKSLFAQGLI